VPVTVSTVSTCPSRVLAATAMEASTSAAISSMPTAFQSSGFRLRSSASGAQSGLKGRLTA